MLRRLLLLAVITALVPVTTMLAPAAANAAPTAPTASTAACSGVIDIQQFAFNPQSVPAGQTSTLSLIAQNCTNQTLQGQLTRFGQFTWPGTGIPPGCPAIDPIALPFTLAPGATFTNSEPDGDTFPSCEATGLQATVEFSVASMGTVAQATANLAIIQPKAVCHVSYTASVYPGGFTASVTITNTGTAAFSSWTLAFNFPGDEHITNAWNAVVTQTGASVSASNVSYNGTIAPGNSQSLGFQGTWKSSAASPTAFTLNGAPCV